MSIDSKNVGGGGDEGRPRAITFQDDEEIREEIREEIQPQKEESPDEPFIFPENFTPLIDDNLGIGARPCLPPGPPCGYTLGGEPTGKKRGLTLGGTGGAVFDPYLLADRTLGCMLLKKLGICLCGQDSDIGNVIYKSVDFGIDYSTIYYPPPCKKEKKGVEADFTMNIVNFIFSPQTADYYARDGKGPIFLTWGFMANPEPHFTQSVDMDDPVFCNQTVYSGKASKTFFHYLAHHGIPIKLYKVVEGHTKLLGEGIINTQALFQYPGKHVYIVTKIVGGDTIGILRGWYELDCALDNIYDYLDYAREEHHRYAILAAHTGPRLRRIDDSKLGTGDECIKRHEVFLDTEQWSLDKQIRRVNDNLVGSLQPYDPPPGEMHFQEVDECNAFEISKRFEAVLFSDGGQIVRPAEVCVPIPRPCDAEDIDETITMPEQGPIPTGPPVCQPPRGAPRIPEPLPEPPPPQPPAPIIVDGEENFISDPGAYYPTGEEAGYYPTTPQYEPGAYSAQDEDLPPPPQPDAVDCTPVDYDEMMYDRIKFPPKISYKRLARRAIRKKFFSGCKRNLGNRRVFFNLYSRRNASDYGYFCANYVCGEADDIVLEIIRLELFDEAVEELSSCYETLFIDFSFLGYHSAETQGLPPTSRMMFRSQHRFCCSKNFSLKQRSILREMLNPTDKITSRVIRFLVVGDPGNDLDVGGRCWDVGFADLNIRAMVVRKRISVKKLALPVYSFNASPIGKIIIRFFGRRLLRIIYRERLVGACLSEW